MRLQPLILGGIMMAMTVGCEAANPGDSSTLFSGRRAVNNPPGLQREARGMWVATVANIDWPSKPGLPVEQQKAELLKLYERAVELNMNLIVLQVRPATDALYASELEPWSSYLTGQQGQAPEPYYDPLEFAVSEAHARGLELHAWFNPFRARHRAKIQLAENHVSKTNPDWVLEYGGYLWLDPTNTEASKHSLDVIVDVATRYDIDGVHVDDYFYPYPINDDDGNPVIFPDDKNWEAYQRSGGTLSRGDWRRSHINDFMRQMYKRVKAVKPWVKVGISPFGIWRPKNPPSIEGFDAYENLYADARLWLQEGWVDYFTPQLYWPIDQKPQSYTVLLDWWIEQNTQGRAIWPGNFTSRGMSNSRNWTPGEIARQIEVTRDAKGAEGNVHFSAIALMRDNAMTQAIRETYAEPALVPAMPWLAQSSPRTPKVLVEEVSDGLQLKLRSVDVPAASGWVIAFRSDEKTRYQLLPGTTATVKLQVALSDVRVASVDRYGQVSQWVAPSMGK